MDYNPLQDRDFVIDIENSRILNEEVASFNNGVNRVKLTQNENVKVLINKEVERVKVSDIGEFNKMSNERRKTTSGKKPPKPPRPPRGLSMDAFDEKLIKEISQLAMIKRARIDRIKALKKMKITKASVSSSSGTFFAMLFTLLFFLVIVFQAGMTCRNSTDLRFNSSPEETGSSLIKVQYYKSLSTNDTNSESPNHVEQVSGLDPENNLKGASD